MFSTAELFIHEWIVAWDMKCGQMIGYTYVKYMMNAKVERAFKFAYNVLCYN